MGDDGELARMRTEVKYLLNEVSWGLHPYSEEMRKVREFMREYRLDNVELEKWDVKNYERSYTITDVSEYGGRL